jgi:hypothetical protein
VAGTGAVGAGLPPIYVGGRGGRGGGGRERGERGEGRGGGREEEGEKETQWVHSSPSRLIPRTLRMRQNLLSVQRESHPDPPHQSEDGPVTRLNNIVWFCIIIEVI